MENKIIIYGGKGKTGEKEKVKKVELHVGQIISIIGPTGAGKTQLINDINCRANKNTPTDRVVKFEGFKTNNIALVSQHNSFLSDLAVGKFLEIHAFVRKKGIGVIKKTIDCANQLTGEKILPEKSMTELSGGQTRSLLIADALVISDSPIVLLDEIENAGINKIKVLDLLQKYNKVLVFVSHDPRIILSSDRRIIMSNGMMTAVIETSGKEREVYKEIAKVDNELNELRNKLRNGEVL